MEEDLKGLSRGQLLAKFRILVAARGRFDHAALSAMPLVFDDEVSDEMVLRCDYSYIQKTWDKLDEKTKAVYAALDKSHTGT